MKCNIFHKNFTFVLYSMSVKSFSFLNPLEKKRIGQGPIFFCFMYNNVCGPIV